MDWLSEPAWSPDGQQLAYVRSLQGVTSGPVFVIAAGGAREENVGPPGWSSTGPSWSLAASSWWRGGLRRQVCGYSTHRRVLPATWLRWQDYTVFGQDSRCLDWSPDGNLIVFECGIADNGGIWVMNTDGTDLQRVFEGSASSPGRAPDGTQLVVTVHDGLQRDVWRVSPATREAINLTQGIGVNWDPTWCW